MNEHGILDLEVPPPSAVHHSSTKDLTDKSGWNHEAGLWANPKGLKTADDSKLVAQLREASNHESFELIGLGVEKVAQGLMAGKPAKVGNLVTDGKVVTLHGNPIFKVENGQAFASWSGENYQPSMTTARNVNGIAKVLGVQCNFSIKGGAAQCNGAACDDKGWISLGPLVSSAKAASTKTADADPNTPRAEEDHEGDAAYETALKVAANGDAANTETAKTDHEGDAAYVTALKEASTKKAGESPNTDTAKNDHEGDASYVTALKTACNTDTAVKDHAGDAAYVTALKEASTRLEAMNAKLASLPKSPEVEAFKAKLAAIKGKVAGVSPNTDTAKNDHEGDASYVTALKEASTKKAESVDGEKQLMDHTDNPVESLADGSTAAKEIDGKDEAHVQEVATAKSASSLDFRPKAASSKTAVDGSVVSAANRFLEQMGDQHKLGIPVSAKDLKSTLYDITDSWKAVVSYLSDCKLMKKDGDHWYVFNRDMASDRGHTSSTKVARHCDAQPVIKTFATLPIRVDCPAGAKASGTDAQGAAWERVQSVDYGEIVDTKGGDGDAVDVFLGPDENSTWVFIVNQTRQEGDQIVPDELKVGLGFWSLEDAREAYLSMFDAGWTNFDSNIVTTSIDAFRDWLEGDHSAKSVSADDFSLTTPEVAPEVVQPTPVVAPEVFSLFSNSPVTAYTASTKTQIKSKHQADVFTMFHNPAESPMDHQSAVLATLLSGEMANPLGGHKASANAPLENAMKVSVETHRGTLIPSATAGRIAEIITSDLNTGYSPAEVDHRAATVGYYGTEQNTFRRTLAKVAGITGELVLQPNFIKDSCAQTHKALTTQHKAIRNRTAYHAVASTSQCGGCQHFKTGSKGEKHCALYSKPIVASVEAMHSLADKVWGGKSASKTTEELSKRAVAHLAGKNQEDKATIRHTAAVNYGDAAENRPTPRAATAAVEQPISARAYVVAELSKGTTPARIAEVLDRSTVHPAAFKKAAMEELNKQKGFMGFLTILPHFAGSCSVTHGQHFSSTAKPKNKRKLAFHSVTKISACDGCTNCIKTASGERCHLYGKPLVATLQDLRKVAAQVFPALAPKVAAMSQEELIKETIPYLAKALGIPEDHSTLTVMAPKSFEVEDTQEEASDKVPVDEKNVEEGTSKNVMDLAMEAKKPKTEDLEDITVKVKEAAKTAKTRDEVYSMVKAKFASVDKRDLRILVNRIASETFVEQSRNNSTMNTEVSTNDPAFGASLSQMALDQIKREKPALQDGSVDLDEMASMTDSSDEFDTITNYL